MARRSWGEGSLFFDNTNKLWTWRGSYYINGEKKKKTLTAVRQVDLKRKIDKFKLELKDGLIVNFNMTVEKWINQWLDIIVKPSVKQRTYENYKERLGYFVDVYGKRQLRSLSSLEIQNFFNNLHLNGGIKNQGIAVESVNCCRRYLKAAYAAAIKNKIVSDNPVEGTRPLRKVKNRITVMTEIDVIRFLDIAKKGDYIYSGVENPNYIKKNIAAEYYVKEFYNLVNLALATGMRIGELRGLDWKSINFSKKYIHVKQQIIKTAETDNFFDEPKTLHSNRKISVDDNVLKSMKEFKAYQQNYADMLGDKFINEHNLCFTNIWGRPFSVSNFRRRYFVKMLNAAGIDSKFTIHSMRHTHATLLLKNNINVKVVSERLGHSSVNVTLNIYAHVLESMEQTAPNMWGQILQGKVE